VEDGLSRLKGKLNVLGVTGNTFDPDPAVAVGTLVCVCWEDSDTYIHYYL
jgi:hypothetical protein